jgi:phospholipid/cholesterol/gamma-HCH transport system substrate-binding protein
MRRPRRQRRRDTKRPYVVLLSGILTLAAVAAFVSFSFYSPRGISLLGYTTVYALVPDSGNLRIHSLVRVDGVRVGEVIAVTPSHGLARLRLKLDPGVRSLPVDTKAQVRGQGLLGARYVSLLLGSSLQNLPPGGTIGAAANPITLSVSDALGTFDSQTRGGMRRSISGLGEGLLGRGTGLNEALSVTPRTQRDLIQLSDRILADPAAVQRLLPSLDSGSTALSSASGDLTASLQPTSQALAPIVDRRAAVQTALDQAPPTLASATPALNQGVSLLGAIRTLATSLRLTLPPAPRGLWVANLLLRESPAPLARTARLLASARSAVPATLRITAALRPLLGPVRRALQSALAPVTVLGQHGCDIQQWGVNWRSVLNQGAPGGSLIGPLTGLRVTVISGTEALAGINSGLPRASDRDHYPAPCNYPPHSYGLGG